MQHRHSQQANKKKVPAVEVVEAPLPLIKPVNKLKRIYACLTIITEHNSLEEANDLDVAALRAKLRQR